MAQPEPITLYTSATPNGFKISITLEELGLSYKARPVDLPSQEQKEEYDMNQISATAGDILTLSIQDGS
jgi:hypothetical protein